MGAAEYFHLMKGFANAMAMVGAPVAYDELIDYILAGLGKKFGGLQSSINVFSNANPNVVLHLSDFYAMLVSHESMKENNAYEVDFSSSANASRRGDLGRTGVAPLILVLMVASGTMAVVAKEVGTIKAAATKVVAINGKGAAAMAIRVVALATMVTTKDKVVANVATKNKVVPAMEAAKVVVALEAVKAVAGNALAHAVKFVAYGDMMLFHVATASIKFINLTTLVPAMLHPLAMLRHIG
jgi:hypothetical protein